MPGEITLKRVAEAAGVSVYGASRAINGQDGVSEETRSRVLKVAEELGYVPNRVARSLRKQTSKSIGILTANSANVFYARLVAGLESVVGPEGYHTLISDATDAGSYSEAREAAFIDALIQLRVAAVILTYRPRPAQMKKLVAWEIPIVFVDCRPLPDYPDYPWVMNDGEAVSRQVGEHFADHGYRHWAFLGHDPGWPTREARELGFSQAAGGAGAILDIVEGGNDVAAGMAAMAAYLDSPRAAGLDAVYASNEPLLNGCVRALKDKGLAIGTDVGVVGFDDFDWAEVFETPFTVVDQSIRQMGEFAGALTLESIGRGEDLAVRKMPEPVLRIRRSCGCEH